MFDVPELDTASVVEEEQVRRCSSCDWQASPDTYSKRAVTKIATGMYRSIDFARSIDVECMRLYLARPLIRKSTIESVLRS